MREIGSIHMNENVTEGEEKEIKKKKTICNCLNHESANYGP